MPRSKGRRRKKSQAPPPQKPPEQTHRPLEAANPQQSRPLRVAKAIGCFLRGLFSVPAKLIGHAWKAIVGLSVLTGIAASAFFFLPRVTVQAGDLLDSSDPLSVPFTITNTNFVPLEKLGVFIGVCRVWAAPNVVIQSTSDDCSRRNYAFIVYPPWQNHRLAMDEPFTINLRDGWNIPGTKDTFVSADISVVVHFKPWISPFERWKQFRFVAEKMPSGIFRWHPKTIDRPD
jgi:hypothetical protein